MGRPRIRRDTPTNPPPGYQPSQDELERDMSIGGATPDELLEAIMGRHPRRDAPEQGQK